MNKDTSDFYLAEDAVEGLREISNRIAASENSESRSVLFPGWHEEVDGEQGSLVRQAARAILNDGTPHEQGTRCSARAVAALLHYVTDMLEE